MRRFLFAAALVAVAAPQLNAQSFATEDPVLRRIWTLGMDSSHIYRLAVASLHYELGDVEAAAEVLVRLDPEEVGCENCLKRMQEILDRAGDLNRSKACELRIERLRAKSQTSSRPHTHCRRI